MTDLLDPTSSPARPAANAPATIEPDELAARLGSATLTVVDVRPLRAYNGWREPGEPRGGHVPGAVSFPAEWLSSVDGPEIQQILARKGIAGAPELVLYGRDDGAALEVAAALADRGVAGATVLSGGFAAWAADPERPVERLAHHDRLVHVDWLAEVLAGGAPEAAPAGPFKLFHVNFGVPEEYADGHIPGAFHLDTNQLENPVDWNRRTPDELDAALRQLGITKDTTVVVYGRDTVGEANEKWPGRRAGQIAATRALLILRYAGVDDVRLLDGGYDWWVRAGHPVETVLRTPDPVEAFGVAI